MSKNVYKTNHLYTTGTNSGQARMIDTNELVASRLEMLQEIINSSTKEAAPVREGFIQGIDAQDVTELLSTEEEESGSNLIKSQANAEELIAQAKKEAERIVAEAREQAKTIVAEGMEQAAVSKKNVLEEARMNGYREGIQRAGEEVEKQKQQLQEQKKAIEAEYEAKYETMESDLVDVITGIYEHIFHVELSSYRQILVHLISTTMRKVESGRNFMIHVSKEDYPFVSMQKKQMVEGIGSSSDSVEVVEDLTLIKGECFIETEGGIFDCGLGTQLKELRKRLKVLSYES